MIIYGARTVRDLVFAHEFDDWASAPDTQLELTIDPPGDPYRTKRVALVPSVVKALKPSPENAIVLSVVLL